MSFMYKKSRIKSNCPLRSGMLEQGVDRIVAQVVDPKINHIFRPQVERVVREFLSPGSCSEEPPAPPPSTESKPESITLEQGTHSFIGGQHAGICLWLLSSERKESSSFIFRILCN